MKRRFLRFSLISFILFTMACQTKSDEFTKRTSAVESIKTDLEAKAVVLDIWTKYSFSERQGRQLYNKYCVVCHGLTGGGDGFNSFNLNPKPKSLADSAYNKALSNESIKKIIAYGGGGMNRSVLMPSYQNTLNNNEIQYLVQYIRTFSQ